MPKYCATCGRKAHGGLCNLVTLSDGTTVHADRLDSHSGDVRERIERGEVKVLNRWIRKKAETKTKARRS